MYTVQEVKDFSNSFGHKPLLTGIETKELPNLLNENEKLLAIAEGNLKYAHNKKEVGFGIIFVTEKRVVFFRKSMIGITTKEEFPISKISAVSYKKGLIQSSLFIRSSGDEVEITQITKSLGEKVQKIISELVNNHGDQKNNTISAGSVGDELMKLATLKNQGILTEEEFTVQKLKLLSK